MKIIGTVQNVDYITGTTGQGKAYSVSKYLIKEDTTTYPQSAVVETFEYEERLPKLAVGDKVEIDFNMKGRESNGKLYHQNIIWQIKKI